MKTCKPEQHFPMKYLNRFFKTTLIIIISYLIYYQAYFYSFYDGPFEIINYEEFQKVPLIAPYSIYAQSEDSVKDWYTLFYTDSMPFEVVSYYYYDPIAGQLNNIDSIGICKNLIVFSCIDNDLSYKEREWFIFDIETKIGRGFVNFSDYQQQLKKAGYQKIQMYNPNVIYGTFEKTSTLPIEWKELQRNEKKKYWWIIKYWFE
jgi:hypothetical protein